MGIILLVTANEIEKAALNGEYTKKEGNAYFVEDTSNSMGSIKGKSYRIGTFGGYNVAHLHLDAQGASNPAATPLVGAFVRELKPVAVIMVGIAFGMGKIAGEIQERKQKIGDVLVLKHVFPYDSRKKK